MRLLSIVALCGVAYAAYVPSADSESPGRLTPRLVTCPAGLGDNGRGMCAVCPPGSFGSGGLGQACMSCATGTTSTGASPSCNLCAAGYTQNTAKAKPSDPLCVACPAGQMSGGARFARLVLQGWVRWLGRRLALAPARQVKRQAGTLAKIAVLVLSAPVGSYPVQPAQLVRSAIPRPASALRSTSCGPQPSKPPMPPVRRAQQQCTLQPGYKWCPVLTGRGGNECINTLTASDSCGGCVALEGEEDEYSGRDCSKIPHVQEVKCHHGRCKILSCVKGYAAGQGACVRFL
ncbi:GCC2 and GCC3 domain protein [Ceratobasidium sp. AG-Ba]|nr:GCC2 and GCC3 domain protein [Ceratobasidium sp. AG-Ba]QRW11138.1 GCC2 and GCC3 domain protein [Ceratobasidium sp. AG-Ba]